MVHFKELRSGVDLAYLMDRTIKFNKWSGGEQSSHLVNKSVLKNSFLSVYDYDLKLEIMGYLIVLFLLIKK